MEKTPKVCRYRCDMIGWNVLRACIRNSIMMLKSRYDGIGLDVCMCIWIFVLVLFEACKRNYACVCIVVFVCLHYCFCTCWMKLIATCLKTLDGVI